MGRSLRRQITATLQRQVSLSARGDDYGAAAGGGSDDGGPATPILTAAAGTSTDAILARSVSVGDDGGASGLVGAPTIDLAVRSGTGPLAGVGVGPRAPASSAAALPAAVAEDAVLLEALARLPPEQERSLHAMARAAQARIEAEAARARAALGPAPVPARSVSARAPAAALAPPPASHSDTQLARAHAPVPGSGSRSTSGVLVAQASAGAGADLPTLEDLRLSLGDVTLLASQLVLPPMFVRTQFNDAIAARLGGRTADEWLARAADPPAAVGGASAPRSGASRPMRPAPGVLGEEAAAAGVTSAGIAGSGRRRSLVRVDGGAGEGSALSVGVALRGGMAAVTVPVQDEI
jgi:hypothetical protein